MYNIEIEFEQKGLSPIMLKNIDASKSILEIAEENNIELHHNCGGVCACTTCHVYVKNGAEFLTEISDKEEDFIDRAVSPTLESRLGCQAILLAKKEGTVKIRIPDQAQFLGE